MKFTLLTLIYFGLLNSIHGQDTLVLRTPEELGHKLFNSFKKNDFDLFKSLLITESKNEYIINLMEDTDSAKAEYRKQDANTMRYLHNQATQNFESILKLAKDNGIEWSNAELVEVKSDSRSKKGVERADIIIIAKSGGTIFLIALSNCHKSETWHIMNPVELKVAN